MGQEPSQASAALPAPRYDAPRPGASGHAPAPRYPPAFAPAPATEMGLMRLQSVRLPSFLEAPTVHLFLSPFMTSDLEFRYSSQEPADLWILVCAEETVGPRNETLGFSPCGSAPECFSCQRATLPPGDKLMFRSGSMGVNPPVLNIPSSLLVYNAASPHYFPLILALRASASGASSPSVSSLACDSVVYYFAVHSTQSTGSLPTLSVSLIQQKVHSNGAGHVLQAAYGMSESSQCVVCISGRADTMVLPCRHVCLCSECARELARRKDKCPVCREPLQRLERISIS